MRKAIASAALAAMLSMGLGTAAMAATSSAPVAQTEVDEGTNDDGEEGFEWGLLGLVGLLGLAGLAKGGGRRRTQQGRQRRQRVPAGQGPPGRPHHGLEPVAVLPAAGPCRAHGPASARRRGRAPSPISRYPVATRSWCSTRRGP